MINCIIIDDEPKGCETLKKILYNYCSDVQVAGIAHNARDGVEMVKQHKPQLVFLDIEMPGGDGFYFLNQFEQVPFRTVFTTAFDHYAIRAIKYAAFDYLLKPLSIEQVRETVEKMKILTDQKDKMQVQYQLLKQSGTPLERNSFRKLAVPTAGGYEFVDFDDIVWIQACDSYSVLHMKSKEQIVSTHNLGHYEDLLSTYQPFLRIHHSHMINLNHVQRLTKSKNNTVLMTDGKELDVSTRKKDVLISLISK